VPLLTLTVHKGFGYGAAAMGGMGAGQSATLAWPTADFNAIPLESGIQAAYRAVLEAADDPVEVARQLEEELGALCGSFPAAEQMKIDDIIDPAESRPRLIQALERALARRARHPEPATRHGFLP
jgi:acetyl-CoA carboxylase carboxyltransferase component